MPIYKKVDKKFFRKWSSDMAYVLGFFAADGYMTINRRGANFWTIEIADKKLLQKIRRIIKSEHKIGMRLRLNEENPIYRLQIGSKEMCEDLRHLGMRERKTKRLNLPNVPNKYFSDFVRGYFDGDGNVWVGRVHKERVTKLLAIRTVFTSCALSFLDALRNKMEHFGIIRGVLSKGKGNYYRLTYSIYGSLKLSDFMYNPVVKRKHLFLQRKKKVFEKYIKMRL